MKLKIKYLLPIAPISLALISLSLVPGMVKGSNKSANQASGGTSGNMSPVQVEVNGQNVPLSDGSAKVQTGTGGTATVNISGNNDASPSQTTETVSPNGSVNVSVTQNSQNQSSHTSIRIRGGVTTRVSDNSDVSVHLNGEGSVQVTK